MPNLSEVVSKLFQKGGVKLDNPDMIALLSNPEISKIPVSDTLLASVESGLHTLDSARAVLGPAIKKEVEIQARAETYNGMDAELYNVASEFGLPDDFVEGLKPKEIKTSARFKSIAAKIKELSEQKVGATGADKKDLVEQINALKLEQGKIAKAHADAIAQEKANAAKEINDMAINSHFQSYAYATEDGTPKELKSLFAKTEVEKKLAELGGIPQYDKTTGRIILKKQDGTDVFDSSNNKVDFYGIADSIVAEKKLIQISKGSQGGNAGGQGSQGQGGAGGNGLDTSSFDGYLAQSIKDHQNA